MTESFLLFTVYLGFEDLIKVIACLGISFSKNSCHIETSQFEFELVNLNLTANQLTGFYRIKVFLKGVSE